MSIRVQSDRFDPGAELNAFSAGVAGAGAVVSFSGLVRDVDGGLQTMEIEHYPGMTEKALAKIRSMKMQADGKEDEASLEEMHAKLVETAMPLVVGFKNISRGDNAAKAPADIEWLLNLQLINGVDGEKSFVEQVVDFATKRANFLGNG